MTDLAVPNRSHIFSPSLLHPHIMAMRSRASPPSMRRPSSSGSAAAWGQPLALRGLRGRHVRGRRLPLRAGTLPAPIALRVPTAVAVALALAIAPPAITPPTLVVQPILAAIAEIAAQTSRNAERLFSRLPRRAS
jgi:hypothetical protein